MPKMVADAFTKPMEESLFKKFMKIIFNEDDTYEDYDWKVDKCQYDTILRFSKRITESGGVLDILRHLEIADGQQ